MYNPPSLPPRGTLPIVGRTGTWGHHLTSPPRKGEKKKTGNPPKTPEGLGPIIFPRTRGTREGWERAWAPCALMLVDGKNTWHETPETRQAAATD